MGKVGLKPQLKLTITGQLSTLAMERGKTQKPKDQRTIGNVILVMRFQVTQGMLEAFQDKPPEKFHTQLPCPRLFPWEDQKDSKHEVLCGQPKVKLTCKFENCFKTYKNQETLDQHVETAHHGKGHKCLCPTCGQGFSSEQSLDRHFKTMHQ